jgi:hypothetical protein
MPNDHGQKRELGDVMITGDLISPGPSQKHVLICGRPAKCKRFFEEGWHIVGCCHLSGL